VEWAKTFVPYLTWGKSGSSVPAWSGMVERFWTVPRKKSILVAYPSKKIGKKVAINKLSHEKDRADLIVTILSQKKNLVHQPFLDRS